MSKRINSYLDIRGTAYKIASILAEKEATLAEIYQIFEEARRYLRIEGLFSHIPHIPEETHGLHQKMTEKEMKKRVELVNKLLVAIEVETNYTYQDVICALNEIKRCYTEKGRNLLNSVSIQEVAKFGAPLE